MMKQRLLTFLAFLFLLTGSAWGVGRSAQTIAQFAHTPPDFDEAVHLLPVRQLAVDLQQGDLAAFVRHTLNQDQLAAYPFVHSWLTVPAWLVVPSITTARTMSAIYLALAVLVAFGLGYDLARNGHFAWLAGFVAGALTLLALPLWAYAGLAYLEGVGLLVTLLALWLYNRTWPADSPCARRYAALTSLAVAAAWLTKYNFGLFLAGGIALNEGAAVWLAHHGRAALDWRKRWPLLGGPAAAAALLWFAWPGHWARFVAFSGAQEGDLSFWRAASWLFYARSLLTQYSAGLPVALLVVAGLVYSLWRWREFRTRSLLANLLVSWVLLVIVPQKEPRFLYTVAPTAFVLAGVWAAAMSEWLWRQIGWRRVSLALVAVVWLGWLGTAVVQRFRFFDETLAAGYASPAAMTPLYRFIQEQTLALGDGVYLLNSWHLFNHPALLWTYYDVDPNSALTYNAGLVAAGLVPEPTPANQDAFIADLRQRRIRYVATIDGSPAGNYTGWAMMEPLVARGLVMHVDSSPTFILPIRSFAYQEALFSGEFPDPVTAAAQSATYQNNSPCSFTYIR